ncbi:MAG: hypothetical protein QMD46_10985 [Methanomicrobiales archaeon]|nr:hypothetical protein [Methanomicrobiales archaeon]MDI6877013.1 hypothetical protein [Methanomicrobiales archaeon]
MLRRLVPAAILIGIVTASSLGCAPAPTLPVIVGTRILQATTGASMAFSISPAMGNALFQSPSSTGLLRGCSGAVPGADPQVLADATGATIPAAAVCCALAIVPLLIRGEVPAAPGGRAWGEYKQQESTTAARMTTTRDVIRTLWDAQGYSNIAVYRDGTMAPCAPGESGERGGELPVAILKPIPLVGGIPTLDHALADPGLLEEIERTLGGKGLPIDRG